jgi:hypothetical protein
MRPGIPSTHLLLLLGYSVLFFLLAGLTTFDVIGFQWSILVFHAVALFVTSIVKGRDPITREEGKRYMLAALLVLLIGHGLCFFNGLVHFNLQ